MPYGIQHWQQIHIDVRVEITVYVVLSDIKVCPTKLIDFVLDYQTFFC